MLKNNESSLIILVKHPSIYYLYPNGDVWRPLFISPLLLFDAAVGIAILQLRMICEHEKLLCLWLCLYIQYS